MRILIEKGAAFTVMGFTHAIRTQMLSRTGEKRNALRHRLSRGLSFFLVFGDARPGGQATAKGFIAFTKVSPSAP